MNLMWIMFVLGLILGTLFGVLIMGIMIAASRGDDIINQRFSDLKEVIPS